MDAFTASLNDLFWNMKSRGCVNACLFRSYSGDYLCRRKVVVFFAGGFTSYNRAILIISYVEEWISMIERLLGGICSMFDFLFFFLANLLGEYLAMWFMENSSCSFASSIVIEDICCHGNLLRVLCCWETFWWVGNVNHSSRIFVFVSLLCIGGFFIPCVPNLI